MRRPVLALSVTTALIAAVGVSFAAEPVPPVVPSTPVTAPFVSDNVTHVGTVPVDGAGVSMEIRTVDDQVRAFVSGAGGLSIYDATDPKAPELLGHLPIYNWENEDIAVSKDGKTAFLTEFTANAYLHVVDVSNPTVPTIVSSLVRSGPHTVVCADDPCGYLYGSNGRTFDVRDRKNPKVLPAAEGWSALVGGVSSGHNLRQDEAGVWISDSVPMAVFRQVDGDPLNLQLLTTGKPSLDTNYQHNNIRPNADQYVPRGAEEGLELPLRPGELLLGNGESNFTGTCAGNAGAFSTWNMAGFDQGVEMQQLDVLRPVSGKYDNGDPAINGLGCSGHWFTAKPGDDGKVLVAAAWYEHGTRFIEVDQATGEIEQVGFFQAVRGATSEAFWMPGSNVVWSIDYHSGIDILEFDAGAEEPSVAETDASWLAKKDVRDVFAITSRELCMSGMEATPEQHTRMQDVTRAVAKDTKAFQKLTRIG